MKPKLVILSGPSGVGKDAILTEWSKVNPRVKRVVAFTSRDKREGELYGTDYFFVSREGFEKMALEGAFLEYKEVFGNYYGTPNFQVNQLLEDKMIAVLKIDVQGALDVFKLRDDAESVFIMPPSLEALEQRLRHRNTDSEEVIQRRLSEAKEEMSHAQHYQHQLVNEDLHEIVLRLEHLFGHQED